MQALSLASTAGAALWLAASLHANSGGFGACSYSAEGPFKGSYRAPSKGFGVDIRQVKN